MACATLIAIGAPGFGSAALAQQVGNYAGTAEDGNAVTFSVGIDDATGNFEITNVGFNFTATCQKTLAPYGGGVGANFSGTADVIGGKASHTISFDSLYVPMSFVFHGSNPAKGKIYVSVPAFVPGTPPKNAQLCVSKNQSFTATFSGPGAPPAMAPGAVALHANGVETTFRDKAAKGR